MDRRDFLKMCAATATFSMLRPFGAMANEKLNRPVRIGFIGTGNRGTHGVITAMSHNNNIEIYALADLFRDRIDTALPYLNSLNAAKGLPSVMQNQTQYADIMQEMIMYFSEKLDKLYYLGVKDVIIDPGFGFAKTLEQNYTIMKHLKDFSVFKEPLLVGISRKSMIYNLLNSDTQKALNGTTVLNTYALMNGAKFIRVHDVKEAVETIKIIEQLNKH